MWLQKVQPIFFIEKKSFRQNFSFFFIFYHISCPTHASGIAQLPLSAENGPIRKKVSFFSLKSCLGTLFGPQLRGSFVQGSFYNYSVVTLLKNPCILSVHVVNMIYYLEIWLGKTWCNFIMIVDHGIIRSRKQTLQLVKFQWKNKII